MDGSGWETVGGRNTFVASANIKHQSKTEESQLGCALIHKSNNLFMENAKYNAIS